MTEEFAVPQEPGAVAYMPMESSPIHLPGCHVE